MTELILNREVIESLIKSYLQAVANGDDMFTFQGHKFLVSYARYFLTYWAPQFDVTFPP